MKKINWPDHLVNLIVVIVGITIAFYLESWKEKQADKRLETKYLTNLTDDLQQDKEYLDTLILINKEHLRILENLAKASINQPYSKDSLTYFVQAIQYSLPFTPQMTTYESMKFSGRVETIQDFDLRNRIVELYEQYYRGMKQYDDAVSTHVTNYVQPYSIKNMVYTGPDSMRDDFLNDNQFRNMIFPYQQLALARLNFYVKVRQELQGILDELRD